jgi:hypothetical protein
MNVVKIKLRLPDADPVLAGRLDGRRVLVRALEAFSAVKLPSLAVLDFDGVEVATSSFLSELVLPLRDHLRLRNPPAFVVLANLNEQVKEELDEHLGRLGEAVLSCVIDRANKISKPQIEGRLEQKLWETFKLLRRKKEATAVELHSDSADADKVGPTAWNNRLAALAGKGLVMESAQGRAKKYRLVLEIA